MNLAYQHGVALCSAEGIHEQLPLSSRHTSIQGPVCACAQRALYRIHYVTEVGEDDDLVAVVPSLVGDLQESPQLRR